MKVALWESCLLSQRLIRCVRSVRSTNSFHPFTLSTLPPFLSPSSPVSPSPENADRYPLKLPDCIDNTLQICGMQIPSEKTETEKCLTNSSLLWLLKVYDCTHNPVMMGENSVTELNFFFFLCLSQKLKLSSKPVWEWRYLCGDWGVIHLCLQGRLGGPHMHSE